MEEFDHSLESEPNVPPHGNVGLLNFAIAPSRVLQDDAVAVWVYECSASNLPIGIE